MPELYPAARRAALAEQAARRALSGLGPGAVLPRLRLATTAELLCPAPPPERALDLGGELEALFEAVRQAVRRRPGWLYAALPAAPLPVLVRPRLLQAAVLCVLRGALQNAAPAVVVCQAQGSAALLCLRGGAAGAAQGRGRGDATPLLLRLAQQGGGTAVFTGSGGFSAVVRLPTAPGLPLCVPAGAGALLADRYSLPYQYLSGFCAGPAD